MNFASSMQGLSEIAHDEETSIRDRYDNFEKINRISGNVALYIPKDSVLNDVAINFFSDSLDALLKAKPRQAAGIIVGAHAKIREMGEDANPSFVSVINGRKAVFEDSLRRDIERRAWRARKPPQNVAHLN